MPDPIAKRVLLPGDPAGLLRGQEGDAWKGDIAERRNGPNGIKQQDTVNRKHLQNEEDFPQTQTFAKGLEFLETNVDADNWLLQIETFDPHEPYYSPQKYQDLYPKDDEPLFDWPPYCRVNHTPEQISHVRHKYAALVSMCDANLGKVLDFMDARAVEDESTMLASAGVPGGNLGLAWGAMISETERRLAGGNTPSAESLLLPQGLLDDQGTNRHAGDRQRHRRLLRRDCGG